MCRVFRKLDEILGMRWRERMIAHEMSETAMRVDMNTTRVSDSEEANKRER